MIRSLALAGMLALPSVAAAQDTVLWYFGNDGTMDQSNDFDTWVAAQLQGDVEFTSTWPSDLSEYRFVILARPRVAFDAGQIADLEAYLDTSGFLVVAGDSLSAGEPQITTINALMAALGRSHSLESVAHVNPLDDNTNDISCNLGNVVNSGGILPTSSPLSVQSNGDIEPGNATIILNYEFQVVQTGETLNFDLMTLEDRVLLAADYDFFSDNECGATAKTTFWNGLYTVVCDLDEDGVSSIVCNGFDCDDTDPLVGQDIAYVDADGDGYGDDLRPAPCTPGSVDIAGDCDDTDPDVNPGAQEICDGIDNDCLNGIDDEIDEGPEWFPDFDGDGFGREGDEPLVQCEQPPNHTEGAGDCDDTNANIHPDATEVCGNNLDDDCSGVADDGCSTINPTAGGTGGDPGETCGCQSASGAMAGLGLFGFALGLFRRRG